MKDLAGEPPPEREQGYRGGGQRMRVRSGPPSGYGLQKSFQEGGLASLPQNPVLGGQEHLLAYITPEEAASLREQGGGVTPTGGQYRGPGGIASFPPMGFSATPDPFGGSVSAAGAAAAAADLAHSNQFNPAITNPELYAPVPRNQELDQMSKRAKALKSAVDKGYAPGLQSKANLSASIGVPDIFGNVTLGFIDHSTGKEYSKSDIDAMSLATYNGIFTGNPDIGSIGDPEKGFGPAVLGFGTTALGMLSPALALPTMAMDIFSGLSPADPWSGSTRSTGLMSLLDIPNVLGDVVGDLSLPGSETVSDAVSDAYAAAESAAQDIYGFVAPPVHDIAESLGLHAEPSQLSVNPRSRGPGIVPLQVPPQVPPLAVPPLEIDHTGPLGTEVQDPLGGDVYESGLISPAYTIDELRQYGIAPVPPTTSMFAAHGGFVDKPLYSRS